MFSFIFNLISHFFHLFTDSCTPGPCSFPPRPRRSQRISGTGREFSFQNVGGCLRFWPGRFLNERFSCCLTWNARPSSRLSKQGRHASFPSGLTSRPLPTLSSIKQTAVGSPHTGVQSSLNIHAVRARRCQHVALSLCDITSLFSQRPLFRACWFLRL